jgi:poly-gamma-glutamate capsule biosynthesis protein CapA/YwtB (metallophosphatase superfamily)
MFAAVSAVLRGADVAIGSLQATLSVGGDDQSCPGAAAAVCNPYQAPPDNAAALQGAGFDVMNVATQHGYDYGRDGLRQTLGALDRYGIRSAGLREKVTYLDVGGTRIAVVGFAPYSWSNNPRVLRGAAELVGAAADKADIVVVVGGGAPFSHAFAHEVIAAGADLVAGAGPDAIYSVERFNGRLTAYSLGNFAGYRSFGLDGNHSLSAILEVRLSPGGRVLGGRLRSIVLTGPGFPSPDPRNRAAALVRDLSRNGSTDSFPMAADGRFGD